MRSIFLACCFLVVGAFAEYKDISVEEIKSMQQAGVPVIDIRTEGEWSETGVIPGSLKLTSHTEKGLNLENFEKGLKSLNLDSNSEFIVICRSGNRSKDLAQKLSEKGYSHIYNVQQGIKSWMRSKMPLQKSY